MLPPLAGGPVPARLPRWGGGTSRVRRCACREGSQTQWSLPVTPHALGTAWYRFRATFSQRWGAYLSVVLLIGLVGGVAMGSLAAARRTQASFSTFLASTNPPDLGVTIYGANAN